MGGTFTRLVQIERDLVEAEVVLRSYVIGKVSIPVAEALDGSHTRLVELLRQIGDARAIARDELDHLFVAAPVPAEAVSS